VTTTKPPVPVGAPPKVIKPKPPVVTKPVAKPVVVPPKPVVLAKPVAKPVATTVKKPAAAAAVVTTKLVAPVINNATAFSTTRIDKKKNDLLA
jgi:hypothetical protein